MIKDFFEWFENWEENKKFDSLDLSSNGFFANGISSISKGQISVDGGNYYVKTPHSRSFKFGYVSLRYEPEDNSLATMSELIAKKRYKQFRFLYANHRPLHRDRNILTDKDMKVIWNNRHVYNYQDIYKKGVYMLVSPSLTSELVDTMSFGDIVTIGLKLTKNNQEEQSMYDNFERMLDSKQYYLKFMTEHCYDNLIKFVIASIFEFSNDDHFDNIMLCKNRSSDRFEDLFLFDKESTAFNPFVALDLSLGTIKAHTRNHMSYNGMPITDIGEKTVVRMYELTRLINKGKLEKKYVDFLEEIAGINFEKLAKEIEFETGLVANQKQLDMYKYGADFAGIIAGKTF